MGKGWTWVLAIAYRLYAAGKGIVDPDIKDDEEGDEG